jgi:hypothetical protein
MFERVAELPERLIPWQPGGGSLDASALSCESFVIGRLKPTLLGATQTTRSFRTSSSYRSAATAMASTPLTSLSISTRNSLDCPNKFFEPVGP